MVDMAGSEAEGDRTRGDEGRWRWVIARAGTGDGARAVRPGRRRRGRNEGQWVIRRLFAIMRLEGDEGGGAGRGGG